MTDNFDDILKLADEQYKNGDFLTAVEYYKKFIEQNPNNAIIHNIIGYLYRKINTYDTLEEQIKHFEKALELKPDFEPAVRNLAFANLRASEYQKAVYYFEKLLSLNPIPDDYMAYACLKLCLGDFECGWKHYEYRFHKNFGKTFYPEIDKPRWEGQKITDKILLVQYEQGFGDSIQFFRYLQQVKLLVGKIIFRVQDELVDLLRINDLEIQIVSDKSPINDLKFDYHIPLMSLPFVLKAQKNNIPLSKGYIKADEDKIEQYRKEFFDNNHLKIGISWRSIGNKRRDVPLKHFYPLSKLKNTKIYSFQKNLNLNKFKDLHPDFEIISLGQSFNDFSDTAAAMANIDLFVTSDNSVFNLAGAMGKKTFVLLSKDAEWRWFLDDKTTPWYDSVRIFKKNYENESWDVQMNRIIEAISGCTWLMKS